MIDDIDASESTLRLLVSQALRNWSTKAVLKLIFEDDCIVRTLAARELQIRGDQEIYDHVIKFVHDDRAYVREICAFTLGQLGTPDMPYRDVSHSSLLNLLKDGNSEVRAAAASALGHLFFSSMPEGIENALIISSQDEDKTVRACVAYALGNSSGRKAVKQALKQLLNDTEESVRSYAELGFEMLKD